MRIVVLDVNRKNSPEIYNYIDHVSEYKTHSKSERKQQTQMII
jgi:hypothetical protein